MKTCAACRSTPRSPRADPRPPRRHSRAASEAPKLPCEHVPDVFEGGGRNLAARLLYGGHEQSHTRGATVPRFAAEMERADADGRRERHHRRGRALHGRDRVLEKLWLGVLL